MKKLISFVLSAALSVSVLAALPVTGYASEPTPPAVTAPGSTDPDSLPSPADPTKPQLPEGETETAAYDVPNDCP